jgi:hypothetical protein
MFVGPGEAVLGLAFFGTVAYTVKSVASAWAQRAQRRAPASIDGDSEARLARIETAVEAMAVEVERISEGQRFTTRLLSERAAPQPNGAQPERMSAANASRRGDQ